MKSTLSEGLSGGVEGKVNPQTVRTDQTHYVRDPTSNTKNNIVSSQTAGLSDTRFDDVFSSLSNKAAVLTIKVFTLIIFKWKLL